MSLIIDHVTPAVLRAPAPQAAPARVPTPPLPPVEIRVNMCAREALLLDPAACPVGHRGVWFYDPAVFGDVAPGREVVFTCCGEPIARGLVTARADRATYPKYCSGLNGSGFLWADLPLAPRGGGLNTVSTLPGVA